MDQYYRTWHYLVGYSDFDYIFHSPFSFMQISDLPAHIPFEPEMVIYRLAAAECHSHGG